MIPKGSRHVGRRVPGARGEDKGLDFWQKLLALQDECVDLVTRLKEGENMRKRDQIRPSGARDEWFSRFSLPSSLLLKHAKAQHLPVDSSVRHRAEQSKREWQSRAADATLPKLSHDTQ